jgi:hypothetical protein
MLMLPMPTLGWVSGPPKGVYRCLSADYPTVLAPRYRTWAVVAVSCKIANCSLKAVKGTQYKLEYASFISYEGLFYDCIFCFVLLLNGQFYEIMYSF